MGEGSAHDAHDGFPTLATEFPEARHLAHVLAGSGVTVAVAESCTGGLLGAVVTSIAGSSAYFKGGVIAYADDVKADHLGVGRHLLTTHGAVSAEVAHEMAAGVRERFEATIGLGITGVAGPDASEHKPAGLVFVAISSSLGDEVIRLDHDQGREGNRAAAVRAALGLCLRAAGALVAAQRSPDSPDHR
jgi:PncC family amidohydrolase